MNKRFSRVPLQAARATVGRNALRLLIFLCGYSNKRGDPVFPGMDVIAKGTGFARNNIPRLLDELEGAGFIRRERQKDKFGRPVKTIFRIIYDDVGVITRDDTKTGSGSITRDDTAGASPERVGVITRDALVSSPEPHARLYQPNEQPKGTAQGKFMDAREENFSTDEADWAAQEADRLAAESECDFRAAFLAKEAAWEEAKKRAQSQPEDLPSDASCDTRAEGEEAEEGRPHPSPSPRPAAAPFVPSSRRSA